MNELKGKVTVLWSSKQQYFHIEPLSKTLSHGLESALSGKKGADYILVSICDTNEQAGEVIKSIKEARGVYER